MPLFCQRLSGASGGCGRFAAAGAAPAGGPAHARQRHTLSGSQPCPDHGLCACGHGASGPAPAGLEGGSPCGTGHCHDGKPVQHGRQPHRSGRPARPQEKIRLFLLGGRGPYPGSLRPGRPGTGGPGGPFGEGRSRPAAARRGQRSRRPGTCGGRKETQPRRGASAAEGRQALPRKIRGSRAHVPGGGNPAKKSGQRGAGNRKRAGRRDPPPGPPGLYRSDHSYRLQSGARFRSVQLS